jgi:hypothetical protein
MSVGDNIGGINWKAFACVHKYDPATVALAAERLGYEPKAADFAELGIAHDDYAEAPDNILVSTGISNITNLLIGGGGNTMTSTRTIVGVGATSTGAAIADIHLGADGGSAWYQVVDSAPTRSTVTATNDTLTCVSTFASGNGNFAWAEWCWATCTGTITAGATLASAATGTAMVNHKIASLGTKVSGAVWVFTATVTLN